MNVNETVFEVHVLPRDRVAFPGAEEEIRDHREGSTPFERHIGARNELLELAQRMGSIHHELRPSLVGAEADELANHPDRHHLDPDRRLRAVPAAQPGALGKLRDTGGPRDRRILASAESVGPRTDRPDIMGFWKNAFSMGTPEAKPLTPRQEEILERLAAKVVEWKMSVPAILFLESVKPLNYVGSQVLVFFSPIVNGLFTVRDYDEFVALMEERGSIERLLKRIEEKEGARESKPQP